MLSAAAAAAVPATAGAAANTPIKPMTIAVAAAGTTFGRRQVFANTTACGNRQTLVTAANTAKNKPPPPRTASSPAATKAKPAGRSHFRSNHQPAPNRHSPATMGSHTSQPVRARHRGRLAMSTVNASPAANAGAENTSGPPATAAPEAATPSAIAPATTASPHPSAITPRQPSAARPAAIIDATANPNKAMAHATCRESQAAADSGSSPLTKFALPPRCTNSRPSSPVTVHSPSTTGHANRGAARPARVGCPAEAPYRSVTSTASRGSVALIGTKVSSPSVRAFTGSPLTLAFHSDTPGGKAIRSACDCRDFTNIFASVTHWPSFDKRLERLRKSTN